MKLALAVQAALALALAAAPAPSEAAAIIDGAFSQQLAKIGAAAGMPGIAGGWFRGTAPVHVGAAGVRKLGEADPVRATDRFHIGSDTKAITATAMASLVRDGLIGWDTTLAQALPGVAVHPAYAGVTVRDLMTMRAGIAPLTDEADIDAFTPRVAGSTAQQRRASAAALLLAMPPASPVGAEAYSNGAYAIAGAIIEAATGVSWEEAVKARVLVPLGMSAATGWPAAGGAAAPWGHLPGPDGTLEPVDPASLAFPDYGTAAGDLSIDAEGLLVFARAHALGLSGIDTGLGLDAALFAAMHATDGSLAMGWGEIVPGSLAVAFGSAGPFYSAMAFDASRGIGAVAFVNANPGEAVSTAALLAALNAGFAAAAVPEPATWTMLIAGFGLTGAALRRRPRRLAA